MVAPPKKAPPEEFSWRITKHVCRACMGRVLMRETFEGRRVYRCSNCGIEREGRSELALCCCGIRFGKAQRDAGIRCLPNPMRTPECMSEIIAQEVVHSNQLRRREEAQPDE